MVELLVVIAITGIVLTAAFTFLFTNQSAYFVVMSRIDAQNNAKIALDNVMTNIRRANQTMLLNQQSGNSLLLEIPDSNGTLISYKYTVVDNKLILTTNSEKQYIVATDLDGVGGFSFEGVNADKLVTVKVNTLSKRYNRVATFEVTNYHKIRVDTE